MSFKKYWRRRRKRRRRLISKRFAGLTFVVIYVVVTLLHLANGFSIGASITGIYHDVRMVTTCPH